MSQTCGEIYIDINGPSKGPNNIGRDIMGFWITTGKGVLLYPHGGVDDKYGGTNRYWSVYGCNAGSVDGWACSGRIIEEGWQMTY